MSTDTDFSDIDFGDTGFAHEVSARIKLAAEATAVPERLADRVLQAARDQERRATEQSSRGRSWLFPAAAAAAVAAIATGTVGVGELVDRSRAANPLGAGRSTLASPEATPVASVTMNPAVTPTAVPALVYTLGPDGYGPLKLGMTRSQAMATGLIVSMDAIPGCWMFFLDGGTVDEFGHGTGVGYLSDTQGVVAISAPAAAKTPQGIGVGSTIAAVQATYPGTVYGDTDPRSESPSVKVSGNKAAHYDIPDGGTGTVQEVTLAAKNNPCTAQ